MEQYNLLPELEQQDRRIANHAVTEERRREMQERLSVLEIKVSTAESRLDETHSNQVRLIDKLDSHILASTSRDHDLQMAVGQITVAVTNLSDNVVKTNDSLTTIATMATESRNQIVKYDTWITAIVKIGSILGIVIGALFTLVQFVESKNHESLPVSQIPAHVADEISNAVKPQFPAP